MSQLLPCGIWVPASWLRNSKFYTGISGVNMVYIHVRTPLLEGIDIFGLDVDTISAACTPEKPNQPI